MTRPLPAPRARLYLAAILAAAAVLFLVGIDWGVQDPDGWAVDELRPESWEKAVTPETYTGWHARYPLLHFQILHHLSQPLRWALAEGGPLERSPAEATEFLILASRALSVVLALLTLVVVYRLGRRWVGSAPDGRERAGGRRTGLFAAAAFALVAPYVYYAKMANLESPYLLWIALAYLFLLRLVDPAEEPGNWDAVALGLAAAAAVATKDQAYALFAFAPLPVLAALARRQRAPGRSALARWGRAALDRRFLLAGASGAVGYALFQGLLTHRVRFFHHLDLLLGPMSQPYRQAGEGAWEQVRLAARFLGQLHFALGPPLFVAAVAGIAWVGVRAWRGGRRGAGRAEPRIESPDGEETPASVASPDRRGQDGPGTMTPARREAWLLGSLLLLGLGYYLTLIAVIGFSFDRYVLPVAMVFALAAGRFFTLLLERAAAHPGRLWAVRAGIAAVFVYAAFYASSVDTRLLADSRYEVEEFIRDQAGDEAHLRTEQAVAIARKRHAPHMVAWNWPRVLRHEQAALLEAQPRFVVINLTDVRKPREAWLVERLDSGDLGYRRILTHRGEPAWNLLDDLGGFAGAASNQRFVNPEMAVWERVGPASAAVREAAQTSP